LSRHIIGNNEEEAQVSKAIIARDATGRSEVDAFLDEARAVAGPGEGARGRLVFALDATMSRQPTWDLACKLQAGMFDAVAGQGTLAVQLVYFRGLSECRASRFVADATTLRRLMERIDCRGGETQIGKVLAHTRREAEARGVAALVFVGDAAEENIDKLARQAGEIAIRGVRAFMFHEGRNRAAERAFREIARVTRGAYLPFDQRSAGELKALLGAVATYAAGGLKALEKAESGAARRLLADLG